MRRDEAQSWFDKAEHDLSAGILLLSNGGFTDTACFFAHQTVEKALKGFLTLHDIKPDRTHNLVDLSREAKGCLPEIQDYQSMIDALNDYYIPARYPADPPIYYSKEDAEEALRDAKTILNLLSNQG